MGARYPVVLDLTDRSVVVVGGGRVAERKARGLVEAGAAVRVVSPEVTDGLARLAERGALTLDRRPYRAGDLRGAALAVAATGDPSANRAVADEADALGVLVNVVDDPDRGGFAVPAVLRRGELVIAVSTSGRTPGLAGALRRRLERDYGPEWATLVELVGELRERLPAATDDAWDGLLAPEVLDSLRRGEIGHARGTIQRCLSSS